MRSRGTIEVNEDVAQRSGHKRPLAHGACFGLMVAVASGCSARAGEPATPAKPPLESYFPLAGAADSELCRALRAPAPRLHGDANQVRRKVVVSDLHLGPGTGQGSRFHGLEDFFAGDDFGRLLGRLVDQPTELIIAGDFIEFWQIEEAMNLLPNRKSGGQALGADQAGSHAAFDVALAAHPRVFQALATFLSAGDHRLVLVVGNHDADLAWPKVQLAIARALGQTDLSQLAFVPNEYRDRGVLVAHGHRLDAANHATTSATNGPTNKTRDGDPLHSAASAVDVALDEDGTCRLVASWGQIFVAKFLGEIEARFPFIDNLYPESSALLWGMRAEPDRMAPLIAGYQFLEMLLGEQTTDLNLEALRAIALSAIGAPDLSREGNDGWGVLWERLPTSGTVLGGLAALATDDRHGGIRNALLAAVAALPDLDRALATLRQIEGPLLDAFRDVAAGDPFETAAAEAIKADPTISVIVFGHTHLPGGAVKAIGRGFYANTGSWTPVGAIERLKKQGVGWTQLALQNRDQFHSQLPAVVIDYRGDKPRPPHLIFAN